MKQVMGHYMMRYERNRRWANVHYTLRPLPYRAARIIYGLMGGVLVCCEACRMSEEN